MVTGRLGELFTLFTLSEAESGQPWCGVSRTDCVHQTDCTLVHSTFLSNISLYTLICMLLGSLLRITIRLSTPIQPEISRDYLELRHYNDL